MNQTLEDDAFEQWDNEKSARMEGILGPMHDIVMHSMIPFHVGGGLDLYYFPNRVEGTGIATKELSASPGEGSQNDLFNCYELVMFTRHQLSLNETKDSESPFGVAHRNIASILNPIARYSAEATLNPGETCEFPNEMPRIGGKCLLFDALEEHPDSPTDFGMMLIIEIFREEMEFSRSQGAEALLNKLQEMEHYPYSDLDREPVV